MIDLDVATVIQAASGIASASLVSSASRNGTSGIVQMLSGAAGGIGGGLALTPLIITLLSGSGVHAYSSILGNVLGGALGGGALVVLIGALTGGNRR